MKKTFLIFNLCVMILLSSCGKKEEKKEGVDDSVFFDITYFTQASRIEGTTAYTKVEGSQEMLFFIPSIGVEGINCVNEDDANSGCFRVSFQGYKEPQLFNNGVCSGGFEGTFTLRQVETTVSDTTDANAPYNPLNPYQKPPEDTTEEEEIPEEEKIYSYVFDMTVLRRSFSAGCNTVNPLDNYSLRILRYPNGDLIMTNSSRSLEFYMIPKLKN